MNFPIYIAIPHQAPAVRWYPNDEPLADNDLYIAGDHDLHSIIRVDNLEELHQTATTYRGHQWTTVRVLAREIEKED